MRNARPGAAEVRSHWSLWALARGVVVGAAALGAEAVGAAEQAPVPADRPFVCAQVVLAIDGSDSTRERAFKRQIDGVRAAFEREPLYQATQDCLPSSVAFAAITWSGVYQQELCLDWSAVTSRDDGHNLAGAFETCRYFGGSTDIGRAVDYGLGVLEISPFASHYRIVLLLTNGRTDRGADASLAAARAKAAAAGVTLAGYALLRAEPSSPSPFYVPAAVPLARYIAEHVSTGPRSFTAHARPGEDVEALLRAFAQMLRQEAS